MRRLEVAHFWQDVCLSIAVHRTQAEASPHEQWLDAGDTRVRLRGVEEVGSIRGDWGLAGWCPILLALSSFLGALLAERPAEERIDDFAGHFTFPGDDTLELALDRMRFAHETEGCSKGIELPACVRGDVLVIVNGSSLPVNVTCSDPSVNTPGVVPPFSSLRAVPDTLATCRFAEGSRVWSYPVTVIFSEKERVQQRATWDGDCGPTLFFRHINAAGSLVGTGPPVGARFENGHERIQDRPM